MIKVAVERGQLHHYEKRILIDVRERSYSDIVVRRNGVQLVIDFFPEGHFYFLCLSKVEQFDWNNMSEDSETVKSRKLVEVFVELVRIASMLILFEIIVFIFVLFFR